MKNEDLVSFEVVEKETDLAISASKNLEAQARAAVLTCGERRGREAWTRGDEHGREYTQQNKGTWIRRRPCLRRTVSPNMR